MPLNNSIKVSAAGAGKTWMICHEALGIIKESEDKKILITTYTNKGVATIEKEMKKQNFGILPKQVVVCSWYHFMLSELIKPYQSCLVEINQIRSLDFSNMYGFVNYSKKGTEKYYLNSNKDVRANKVSELAIYLNNVSKGAVINRLENIYSYIYLDEVQDMAGYDLELIDTFIRSKMNFVCVGDNKQATFTTHNAKKNKNKAGVNIWDFFVGLETKGLINIEKNNCSRRFNKDICEFANSVYPNSNSMCTCMNEVTGHDGVFIIKEKDVDVYYQYFRPTVLKYDVKTITGNYQSLNFGECKGMTFDRVMMYSNGVFDKFLKGIPLTAPSKYYVGVTRPKYSLAIIQIKYCLPKAFKEVEVSLGETKIVVGYYQA